MPHSDKIIRYTALYSGLKGFVPLDNVAYVQEDTAQASVIYCRIYLRAGDPIMACGSAHELLSTGVLAL